MKPGSARRLFAFLLLSALSASAALCAKAAAPNEATVVSISDGDTVMVRSVSRGERRVRLAAIDAPERDQASGAVSRRSLSDLLLGKSVRVEEKYTDRYGRVVAKIFVDGGDAGLQQLRRGMAWHYLHHAAEQTAADRQAYAAAEQDARRARRGLWSEMKPVAPWEFRRLRQAAAAPRAASTTPAAAVVGNRRSRLYHLPGCPGYTETSAANRVIFASVAEAEKEGYIKARNCAAGSSGRIKN